MKSIESPFREHSRTAGRLGRRANERPSERRPERCRRRADRKLLLPRQGFSTTMTTRSRCRASLSLARQGQVACCTWTQARCQDASQHFVKASRSLAADSTAYWNAVVHGRKRWMFLKPEDRRQLESGMASASLALSGVRFACGGCRPCRTGKGNLLLLRNKWEQVTQCTFQELGLLTLPTENVSRQATAKHIKRPS